MSFNLTAAASAGTLPVLNSCNSIKTIKKMKQLNGNSSSNNKLIDMKMNGTHRRNSVNGMNSDRNLDLQFKAACDAIQNLPKNGPFQPSNELLLKFYGYFKQATNGPCRTTKPSIFKVVERAKWDAWNSVRDLSKDEAMHGYIDEIKSIIETMPHNEYVQKLCEVIGPVFEYVNEDSQTLNNNDYSSDEELSATNINNNHIKLNGTNGHNIKPILNGNSINLNGTHKQETNNNTMLSCLNSNNDLICLTNGNGQMKMNGNSNHDTNSIEVLQSDDEEDFCDTTSEFVNEQESLIQNIKKQLSNKENDTKSDLNQSKLLNTSFREEYPISNGFYSNESYLNSNGVETDKNEFSSLIHKFGGEMNSPPSGQTASCGSNQQTVRQSRPGSSQSVHYTGRQISLNQSSGSGGGYPPNENFLNPNYMAQDTNRQILLILLRLQQDTNNVITRLSYLEATVMSLTNNLQMNRIENSIQMNNQVSSAFSLVNNSPQSRASNSNRLDFSTSLYNWFRNIDWKTVTIALLWPFVIRLVFYLFRKIKLVVKFKRIRQEFGPKF